MSHLSQILDAIGRLMSYPDEHAIQTAELLYILLQSELPEVAHEASAFGAFVESLEADELEEAYSRTFDVNPACAPEVGWHLFGEEYARGLFLVRLRQEMRARGIEESSELPDHIAHVLAVVEAMEPDEAQRFVRACVLPSVDKMQESLDTAENPYRHLIGCLRSVLEDAFGRTENDSAPSAEQEAAAPRDLLQDFPMPGVMPAPVELVPLRMDFHDGNSQTSLDLTAARPAEPTLPQGGHADAIPVLLRDKIRHGIPGGTPNGTPNGEPNGESNGEHHG